MPKNNLWKRINSIGGWISYEDFLVFSTLLSYQNQMNVTGDLLEIGVFQGQTSVLMGYFLSQKQSFHACDIFDKRPSETRNAKEFDFSYGKGVSQENFLRNYKSFHSKNPIIHACESKVLASSVGSNKFRLIHIDGSHLYENVILDSNLSLELLVESDSLLVFDDFRQPHAIGVMVCVSNLVLSGRIEPLLFSRDKAYFVMNPRKITPDKLYTEFNSIGLKCVFDEVGPKKFLRLMDSKVSVPRDWKKFLVSITPPILLQTLRKVKQKVR
jgi:hypothetical protein